MNKTDLVKEWFDIAADDLRAAKFLFDKLHPKPLEIICYHCQQSVEKVLKGFLTDRGIEPPHTHNLEDLRLMCMQHDNSFAEAAIQNACVILREYANTTRYPDRPEILETNAEFALNEAEKIYALCANLIPELQLQMGKIRDNSLSPDSA